MVIYNYIYQKGEYFTFRDNKKAVFVICRDDNEKGYANIVGFSSDWETAKKAVDEAGALK